jgi:hypothetical protein
MAISSNRNHAFAVVFLTLVSCVFALTPSRADEVDIAVDAFAIAGTSLGFTLDATEKTITKAIVRCVGTRKQLLICARDEVIRRLPQDAQPIVKCLLDGKRIDDCAEQAVLQRLPPETRAIAQCVAQGRPLTACGTAEVVRRMPPETQAIASCLTSGRTFEACAGAEMARRLPPQTNDLATCIAQRSDFGKCAEHAAANTAHREALNLVEKLKADGRTDLGAGPPSPMRNIINVMEGIRDDDWGKVTLYGGAEVYKAAAKIVLDILLTPVFQPLIGPIVDTIVQNRVDLFTRLVKALKRKDSRAVGEVAVEGYLIMQVEIACSLPMPDEMREALCGTVGKIIRDVASVGGEAADLAKRLITKPLAIPATVWNETEGAREWASGKKRGCEGPPNYYAARYVACYHRAAYLKISEPNRLEPFRGALNLACRQYYDQCFFSDRFNGLCNPQRDMFSKHVDQLAGGLHHAAAIYARSLHHTLTTAGKQVCNQVAASEKIKEFTTHCEHALHKQVPMKGNASNDTCHGQSSPSSHSAHWEACNKAIEELRPQQVAADACRVASATPVNAAPARPAATPQTETYRVRTPQPGPVPNRPFR